MPHHWSKASLLKESMVDPNLTLMRITVAYVATGPPKACAKAPKTACSTAKGPFFLTVLFSVTIMPNGATIGVFVIVQAVVVAAVVVGAVFYGLHRAGLPAAHPAPAESAAGEVD